MRLFILAILMGFPLLEGAVLYKLAAGPDGHGGWVLAWLVFAAIAGVALIKQARFAMVARLGAALAQGHFSLAAVIDSFRTVIAGLLLIFPGVISDVMALILLLIPIREPAFDRMRSRHAPQPGAARVIDGEFHREL
ncbi:MAG: FxsA family protein [Betaproteobacteria bacterium]|nr:FxsA family protein [Betaproteobacteria bacterium]